jgi:hypothetical protein
VHSSSIRAHRRARSWITVAAFKWSCQPWRGAIKKFG